MSKHFVALQLLLPQAMSMTWAAVIHAILQILLLLYMSYHSCKKIAILQFVPFLILL